MSNTTPVMTKVETLSKDEAAERLNVSVRRVLEYAQSGALRSEKVRNPQTNLWVVRIHAGDVERLRDERSMPQPRAPQPSQSNKLSIAKPAVVTAAVVPAPAAPLSKPWLTLAEAEEYTGLPAGELLFMIEGGDLLALNVGVRPGGRFRIKKADLDAIQGENQATILQ